MIGSLIGTKAIQFEVRSSAAVNMPPPTSRGRIESSYVANTRSRFRVLINNREPENRGAFFDAPGELVDVPSPIPDGTASTCCASTATRSWSMTPRVTARSPLYAPATPRWSMAITVDRKYLLVGNDNSQIANRYDLDTLQQLSPIIFPPDTTRAPSPLRGRQSWRLLAWRARSTPSIPSTCWAVLPANFPASAPSRTTSTSAPR